MGVPHHTVVVASGHVAAENDGYDNGWVLLQRHAASTPHIIPPYLFYCEKLMYCSTSNRLAHTMVSLVTHTIALGWVAAAVYPVRDLSGPSGLLAPLCWAYNPITNHVAHATFTLVSKAPTTYVVWQRLQLRVSARVAE